VAKLRRRTGRAVIPFVLLVVVVGGLLQSPVLANPFGTVNPPCGRLEICWYNGTHQDYWYDSSVGAAWKSAGEYARTTEVDGTVISTGTVSGHNASDVSVYLYSDPNDGVVAYTDCISWTNALCNHWHVNFDTADGPYTDTKRKSNACHEFGHTLGLHHWANHQDAQSCMENVPEHWHLHWNSHDVDHVNTYYS
jgi:hypothetical protein